MEKQALNARNLATEFHEIALEYSLTDYLGSGAYGIVCSAQEKQTEKNYAIKKCKNIFHSRTLAKRTLREMKILRSLNHPNIVELKKVFIVDDSESFSDLYMVFELMDTDLAQVIKSPQRLRVEHIQHFTYQLLQALKYLHDANIIHRDIKPRNILINSDCTLKLADFGLARVFNDGIDHTSLAITEYVTTRWYRAPEILAGWTYYGKAVDMWAVGCIIAELFKRSPLFPGGDSLKQLELLLNSFGRPEESFTIKCKKSSKRLFLRTFEVAKSKPLDQLIGEATNEAKDLIQRLLIFDPLKRLTATECLYHSFFMSYPLIGSVKLKESVHIPSNAFEHERWKPTLEEFRLEILKEVEDFTNIVENVSTQSTTMLIETDISSISAEEINKMEKLSTSTAVCNLSSLQSSVSHFESSTTIADIYRTRGSRSFTSKSEQPLSRDSMESAAPPRHHKSRNWSRDTIVEEYMVAQPPTYETMKTLHSIENPKAPSTSRILVNASCQVNEKDFEESKEEMIEEEIPVLREEVIKMVEESVQKTQQFEFYFCGAELKPEKRKSTCSSNQSMKSFCVIC